MPSFAIIWRHIPILLDRMQSCPIHYNKGLVQASLFFLLNDISYFTTPVKNHFLKAVIYCYQFDTLCYSYVIPAIDCYM